MSKKIFYNSSLPRAGSTLFQNLIGQNPEFYVTPTSGLIELVFGAKNNYNHSQEFKAAPDQDLMDKAFLSFCRDGMQGYYNVITDKPYILDKSRGWGINYGLLNLFSEKPKIVCMVRDVRSIYSSMEKNFRKNPHKENHVQNPNELIGTTLDKRIDIWASGAPVGISMDRLKDTIQQGIDKKILFIRYEDLMSNPEEEIRRFYEYLELPYYEGHNFETIEQVTNENDVVHGIYGDHKLRKEFKKLPDDYNEILGYELSTAIKNHYKWFYDFFGYV
jgi:sulfotransferase